jgi:3-dehydroquinate synthase
MKSLTIELGERSYPIAIDAGLLKQSDWLRARIAGQQVLIISNEVVAPLYLKQVLASCDGLECRQLILPDGEAQKTPANWQRILDELADMRASRDVTLIALGGGVIGDLTGFAAASWMRGVPFLQIPTTLLAQADASVGGKTAVNHPAGKNLIGAFHQPCGVLIDTDTLGTLPDREFRAGLAEVLKYGLIGDRAFFNWMDQHARDLLNREPTALSRAIEKSCHYKAEIVAADEREAGRRALLNLGHSFGHAIESVAGYGQILHGEAVAIGCCAAAVLSANIGMCEQADAEDTARVLASLGLPVTIPRELPSEGLLAAMQLDKKNLSGHIRLVLLHGIGQACLSEKADHPAILSVLDQLR